MPQKRDPDPFAPVEGAVTMLLSLVAASFLVFAVIAGLQTLRGEENSVSVATIGDETACVLVRNEVVPSSADVPQRGIRRDVASVRAEELAVCLKDPTVWQKTASALGPVGDLAFIVGGLVLTRRVTRGGRRDGLFTEAMAGRTRQLGWFLLFMTLVWPFVAAAGRGVVLTAAVPRAGWVDPLSSPGVPWALVVVALGVLTTARILRRAVPLQQEVDATV